MSVAEAPIQPRALNTTPILSAPLQRAWVRAEPGVTGSSVASPASQSAACASKGQRSPWVVALSLLAQSSSEGGDARPQIVLKTLLLTRAPSPGPVGSSALDPATRDRGAQSGLLAVGAHHVHLARRECEGRGRERDRELLRLPGLERERQAGSSLADDRERCARGREDAGDREGPPAAEVVQHDAALRAPAEPDLSEVAIPRPNLERSRRLPGDGEHRALRTAFLADVVQSDEVDEVRHSGIRRVRESREGALEPVGADSLKRHVLGDVAWA